MLRRGADVAAGPGWMVGIDAGVVRAHQHAAGARYQPPADVTEEVLEVLELVTGGRAESQGSSYPAELGGSRALAGRVDQQDSSGR
jgi:hypothetical protein